MKDNYYFDNAATTWPKPEAVYQFMDSFYRSHGVNPGRAGHQMAVEAEQMIVQTRGMMAEFFGFSGDRNRVVFGQNVTDALNTALFGLLQSGDHLVTTPPGAQLGDSPGQSSGARPRSNGDLGGPG